MQYCSLEEVLGKSSFQKKEKKERNCMILKYLNILKTLVF